MLMTMLYFDIFDSSDHGSQAPVQFCIKSCGCASAKTSSRRVRLSLTGEDRTMIA